MNLTVVGLCIMLVRLFDLHKDDNVFKGRRKSRKISRGCTLTNISSCKENRHLTFLFCLSYPLERVLFHQLELNLLLC